ncbi:uncharacterized protein At1g01500-like [Andrographis paniculata]|uniref:uncharacterized protein At1g01500-like n=1 Tax=Andrographis paniculata TaxID=175694 RepID=UPI0021E8615D|nr:uncharacterized protein At1g01500-like [Andrographis paniculata]XP_051147457.1 uncharacterized protein At1g01500-like [Andrographis paniculata]XP_051147458.1 uncharacterized protein At1g01500-like [Andrographis paniculata]XP_051147460.1 uncharacterized protein At1g01500-like [Andrographis paniculata]
MDVNEETALISLRDMANSDEDFHENGELEHKFSITRQSCCPAGVKAKTSLDWLDLRVFYVRVSECIMDDGSMPGYLTLNHVPLSRDTLLEVNCVRASIYSDGVSTLLKRDRLDKRSEEVTFVNTDSIRVTGSVMFEVFHENKLVLNGTLEFSGDNGFVGELRYPGWSMNCESDILPGTGFFKGNPSLCSGLDSGTSPVIEVYVAGSFLGTPIVLTQTMQVSPRRKQFRKGGLLESIPENGITQNQEHHFLTAQSRGCRLYNPQDKGNWICSNPEYLEGEDGELSWFNAGVRVGVGIGLSICLGVGIGLGLLVRTYQGTTRNFRRRVL